mmetsp:Transcript_130095/g.324335  ORF Transcript_130095/g.324335 Transcript_130095/m.324335 type:complete len:656 (+) Transcript_130095:81-2048(+)
MGKHEAEELTSDEGSESRSDSEDVDDAFFHSHHCTDPICALGFIAAVICFLVIFGIGLTTGNVEKFAHGLDSQGRICGVSQGVEDLPYMYFCPKDFSLGNVSSLARLNLLSDVPFVNMSLQVDAKSPVCLKQCPMGANATDVALQSISSCAVEGAYSTTPVLTWYCLPDNSKLAQYAIKLDAKVDLVQMETQGHFFGVQNSWPVLLLIIFVATALGYVYLFLLRALAKGLIWLCVALSILSLVGFGIYLWTQAGQDATETLDLTGKDAKNLITGTKATAIALWVLAFLMACLVCCCYSEVDLSTAAVQTGTEVIWKMPLLLLAPLVKALTKATLACIFVFVGWSHLWAMAEYTGVGFHRYAHFTSTQKVYLLLYAVIGMWILEFLTALYQFSIAYAVAKYYYTDPDEDGHKDVDCFGVLQGVHAGLRFHLGTLAFGAAIITALHVVQKVLEYAEIKNKQEGNNQVVACVLSSILCCCYCLEGIVQFVSKNAYIDTAISSTSFCRAVQNVGAVIIKHGAAMAVLNGATVIFQIVGMVAITASCGLLAYFLLSLETFASESSGFYVSNQYLATVVACILGLIVSWAFMTVFDVATDTLLMCISQDSDTHAGRATHAEERLSRLFQQAHVRAEKRQKQALAKAQKAAKAEQKAKKFGK